MSPTASGDEFFKYTLNDKALGAFSGLIYVARGAQKTEAYQNNRNLLLSDTPRCTLPQLEIYADDVKCSHGMTTGEIDEKALFYMQQRGIPYHEARLILTIAFASDILEKIEDEQLKEKVIRRDRLTIQRTVTPPIFIRHRIQGKLPLLSRRREHQHGRCNALFIVIGHICSLCYAKEEILEPASKEMVLKNGIQDLVKMNMDSGENEVRDYDKS